MPSNTSTIAAFTIQFQLTSQYLSLNLGLTLFIGGIIGNLFNMHVFLTIGNYKNNPCSLYILVESLLSLAFVLVGIGTRILNIGLKIDLSFNS